MGSPSPLMDWLDNGLRGTMISSEVAKELDLKGRKEMVSVSTLLQQEDKEFEVVEFKLQSDSGEEVITVEDGLVSEKFNIAVCLPEDINSRSHPHLTDIEILEVQLRKVTILTGKDVIEAHEVFKVRKSNNPDSQLQALRGPLGWVITGTIHSLQNHRNISVSFVKGGEKLALPS